MTTQRGQIFRTERGLWAIRYRDAHGRRPQETGFRTKGEAREALEEALRRVRLGPVFRPNATLRELADAFLEQYDVAPATVKIMRYNLKASTKRFGDHPIGDLSAQQVGAWRKSLPEGRRYYAHRALRQVLEAGVRWKWLEDNVAAQVKNPAPRAGEIDPFNSWEEIRAIADELNETYGAMVIFMAGTGVRPEEAFGAEWRDVDLKEQVVTVRRAYADGRLKDYTKTARSRRRVPLRAVVLDALARVERRRGILFPTAPGGRIQIHNWRQRHSAPALDAGGVAHRRIYDLRHTYATWSLAAGIDIFTLARRMGMSVAMIDRTYGHLAAGADEYERDLLDAFDRDARGSLGRYLDAGAEEADSKCA